MSFYHNIINLQHQRDRFQDVYEEEEPIPRETYVKEQDIQEIEIIDPLTYCSGATTKNVIKTLYFCDFCYANFKSTIECEMHKKICNNDSFVNNNNIEITTSAPETTTNNKTFNCEHCDKRFKREYWYTKHLEKLHKPLIENNKISSSDSKTLADSNKTFNTNSSISIHNIISGIDKSIQSQTNNLHKFAEIIQAKINNQNSLKKKTHLYNDNIDACQKISINEALKKQLDDIQFQKQLLNDIFSTLKNVKKETDEIESSITGLMRTIEKSDTFIDNNNNNSLNDFVENLESKKNKENLTLHNINVEEINLNNSEIEIIEMLQEYSINNNNINKENNVINGNNDYIKSNNNIKTIKTINHNNAIDSSVAQQKSANSTANAIQIYLSDTGDKEKCHKPNNKKENTANSTENTSNANKQSILNKNYAIPIPNEMDNIPNESDGMQNESCSTNEKKFRNRNVHLKYLQLSVDNIIYTVKQNDDNRFICTLCKVSFKNRFNLRPHILRVHAKQKTKICLHCKRAFATTGDLTRHVRIHTGTKPFKCKYSNCKLAFISSGDLYKHIRRHKNIRNHICGKCDRRFERGIDLKRHYRTHNKSDPNYKYFSCGYCVKSFPRKDQYRLHVARVHNSSIDSIIIIN